MSAVRVRTPLKSRAPPVTPQKLRAAALRSARLVDGAVQVDGCALLRVDADDVGARLREVRHPLLRLHNHLRTGQRPIARRSGTATTTKPQGGGRGTLPSSQRSSLDSLLAKPMLSSRMQSILDDGLDDGAKGTSGKTTMKLDSTKVEQQTAGIGSFDTFDQPCQPYLDCYV